MTRSLTCSMSRSLMRSLLTAFTIALACAATQGETDKAALSQLSADASVRPTETLDKQEVFRRIGIYEDIARNADSLHLDRSMTINVYKNLGGLYEMAGMYPRAEAAMKRALEWMKDGPQDDLAEELHQFSTLHSIMGNLRQSEKDQAQALAVREKIGDPVGIALTWIDMAAIYYQGRQYKKALEYAQKSYDVLGNRTDLKPSNHIAVLQTMAFILCGSRQCGKAIPIMREAVDESRNAFGPDSLSAAAQGFALGYVYWQSGDTADAGEWMRRSLPHMKVEVGWGQLIYINGMRGYARFLRETGQREAASIAESEVHRIESVVDARTLTTRGGEFLSAGTR